MNDHGTRLGTPTDATSLFTNISLREDETTGSLGELSYLPTSTHSTSSERPLASRASSTLEDDAEVVRQITMQESQVREAGKEAFRLHSRAKKALRRILVNGQLPENLRDPKEARILIEDLMDEEAGGSTTVESIAELVAYNLSDKDIVDFGSQHRPGDKRFRLQTALHGRVSLATMKLESTLQGFFDLEQQGEMVESILFDVFIVIQSRIRDSLDFILERKRLHLGYSAFQELASTDSDLYSTDFEARTLRQKVNRLLFKPSVQMNLSPEYRDYLLEAERARLEKRSRTGVPPSIETRLLEQSPGHVERAVLLAESIVHDWDEEDPEEERTRDEDITIGPRPSRDDESSSDSVPVITIQSPGSSRSQAQSRGNLISLHERSSYRNPAFELPNPQPPSLNTPAPRGEVTLPREAFLNAPSRVEVQKGEVTLQHYPITMRQTGTQPAASAGNAFSTISVAHPATQAGAEVRSIFYPAANPNVSVSESISGVRTPTVVPYRETLQVHQEPSSNPLHRWEDASSQAVSSQETRQATRGYSGATNFQNAPTPGVNADVIADFSLGKDLNPSRRNPAGGDPYGNGPPGNHPGGRGGGHPGGGPPNGGPPGGGPPGGGNAREHGNHHPPRRDDDLWLEMKVPQSKIPEWDGNESRLLQWVDDMFELAHINIGMAQALGAVAHLYLKGRAKKWWSMLRYDVKVELSTDWMHFFEGVRIHWFTPDFLTRLQQQYDSQSFRQPGHSKEMPFDFLHRRLRLHRYLATTPQGAAEEIRAVLTKAPLVWRVLLPFDNLTTIDGFMADVHAKDRELVSISTTTELIQASIKLMELSNRPDNRQAHAAETADNGGMVEDEYDGYEEELPSDTNVQNGTRPTRAYAGTSFGPARSNRRQETGKTSPRVLKFPREDSVVSRNVPARPCKVCGSPKHFDRDCPHWKKWEATRMANQIDSMADSLTEDPSEVTYLSAYCASVLDSHESMTSLYLWTAQRSAAAVQLREQAKNRRPFFESVTDNAVENVNPLPPNSPILLYRCDPSGNEVIESEEKDEEPDQEAHRLPAESTDWEEWLEKSINREEPTEHSVHSARRMEDFPEDPRLDTSGPIREITPTRKWEPGQAASGISALSVPIAVASASSPLIWGRMDSGADISLISKEFLDSVPKRDRPRIRKGAKLRLYQLTDGFTISGYVQMPVFMRNTAGETVKLVSECYVVPGMTSRLLLGEDFLVNYEIGTTRSISEGSYLHLGGHDMSIKASSTRKTPPLPFKVLKAELSPGYLKSRAHKRRKAKRQRAKRASTSQTAKVARDTWIKPHSCANIEVRANFSDNNTLFVEKTVLGLADGSCLLTAPCLISKLAPRVPVSNPTPQPKLVRAGEILGQCSVPEDYFERGDEERSKHAAAVKRILQDSLSRVNLPGTQGHADEEEGELNGPKTAEMVDPEIYPSEQLESILDIGPEWPPDQRASLLNMLNRRQKAFGFDGRLGQTSKVLFEIRLQEGQKPISVPMYAASPAKREVIDKQTDQWLTQEVIEPSESPWAAPVVIAYRNGKPCFCIDYRKLNAATVRDEFPIPRQSEIMQALSGAQVLSTLDALSGFTQISVAEGDREKTAFRSHRGLFQFRRLPFGLTNGPAAFQRLMQSVLAPYLWLFALVYIDDIVVFSRSWNEHITHLDQVLEAIEKAGVTLSPTKCHLGYTSILLLGQKVGRLGLSTHEEKVKAVAELARPTKVSELQTFLGMVAYFSTYIPYYSFIVSPLFHLLRKDVVWEWTPECEHAWSQAKAALQGAPVLGHPMQGKPYRLYTDASQIAVGCCLQQVQPITVRDLEGTKVHERLRKAFESGKEVPSLVPKLNSFIQDLPSRREWSPNFEDSVVHVERVIAYWSPTCKAAEVNYTATEREALAAKEGLVRFQPFIEGEEVALITDHAALQWARTYENSNRHLAAWGSVFAAFKPKLDIIHRAGRVHSNVDPLSRLPRAPPEHTSPQNANGPTLVPDQDKIASEEARHLSSPALRVSSYHATRTFEWTDLLEPWKEELVEVHPERNADRSVSATTRKQARARNETIDSPSEVEEQLFRSYSKLLVSMSDARKELFKKGYLADPFFREKWKKATESIIPAYHGQCFYKDQGGLLFIRVNNEPARLCVPRSEVAGIIAATHDSPFEGAHEGPAKLGIRLSSRFYWHTLREDVKEYTRTCDVCQKIKPDRRARQGLLRPNPIPVKPYEWVSLDLITGLPTSEGYDAVLVMVDRCTKHAQFVPCKGTLDSSGFARMFIEHVVYNFGLPEHIIADRDARWTSRFWKAVAKELKLEMSLSSSHHPQHDGQTERTNQSLEIMLRAYVKDDRKDWAKYLRPLAHAYNSSVHSATGYSPYYLLYGLQPKGATDFVSSEDSYVKRPVLEVESAVDFILDLELHRRRARDAMAHSQAQMAKHYNKGRSPTELEVGSKVLINPHSLELVDVSGTGKKLMQRRTGPFLVQEKISPVTYRLQIPDTYPMHPVLNIAHLKEYHEDDSQRFEGVPRPILQDPRRSDLYASEEYEVEAIVAWRRSQNRRGLKEYLVRWKGYGPEDDTWQSEVDLRNAHRLLKDYQSKHPETT